MRKVSLQSTQASGEGFTSNQLSSAMIGKRGIAETSLRPSGKVSIEGEFYDAYSRGEYIEKGTQIEVIEMGSNSLKVKSV
jgi:membrane-bound serine protease (ClpP class)